MWEHGIFSGALLLLLLAVLLAIHRTGAHGAFWVGFASFGGAYLGAGLIPPVETRLISTQGIQYALSKMPGSSSRTYSIVLTTPTPSTALNPQGTTVLAVNPSVATITQTTVAGSQPKQTWAWAYTNATLLTGWGRSPENFVKIGHSLIALVLAWCGGMLSRRLSWASGAAESLMQRETVDRGVQATDGTGIEHG